MKSLRTIGLECLSQRFGVRVGFFAKPKIRKYRYEAKLPSASAFALKEFKDQLSQCILYARAYNQSDKLEGRFVVDLAKRLPFSTRQEFLKYLSSRYGHTNEPSFQSLFKFASHKKERKFSDFGILLLNDRGEARGAKESFKNKSVCPVRQTLVGTPDKSKWSPKSDRKRFNNVFRNKSD